jgi:hypothetical protein
LVVAGIVLVAVIVAATLIADHGGAGNGTGSSNTTTTPGSPATAGGATLAVRAVTVWMNTTGHTPDNGRETAAVFDGKTSTAWETDFYQGVHASRFGDDLEETGSARGGLADAGLGGVDICGCRRAADRVGGKRMGPADGLGPEHQWLRRLLPGGSQGELGTPLAHQPGSIRPRQHCRDHHFLALCGSWPSRARFGMIV